MSTQYGDHYASKKSQSAHVLLCAEALYQACKKPQNKS